MSDYDFESYMKDPELTAGIECFKAEDWKGAFDHYLTSSMNGNPEAQVRLGGLFYYGRGTEADPKKALMWYRKAAVAGNAAAQNEVGVMFHLGNGTQRSDAKTFEWLKASANQGYAQAFYNLGTMYEGGGRGPDRLQAGRGAVRPGRGPRSGAGRLLSGTYVPQRVRMCEGRREGRQTMHRGGRQRTPRRLLRHRRPISGGRRGREVLPEGPRLLPEGEGPRRRRRGEEDRLRQRGDGQGDQVTSVPEGTGIQAVMINELGSIHGDI